MTLVLRRFTHATRGSNMTIHAGIQRDLQSGFRLGSVDGRRFFRLESVAGILTLLKEDTGST